MALATEGLRPTPELLAELNAADQDLVFGRLFHQDDAVWVSHSVLGESIDRAQLDNAVRFVRWAAETYGPDLADRFGNHPEPTMTRRNTNGGTARPAKTPGRPRATTPKGDSHGQRATSAGVPEGIGAAGYL